MNYIRDPELEADNDLFFYELGLRNRQQKIKPTVTEKCMIFLFCVYFICDYFS